MADSRHPSLQAAPLIGQRFLQALNGLVSTARIHLDNNVLLQRCADEFHSVIEELLSGDDEINLLAAMGSLYLQQQKIMLERSAAGLGRKILAYFEKREIEGLRFNRGAAYVSYTDLLVFIRLLNRAGQEDSPLDWLQEQLDKKGFQWVELIDTSRAQSLAALFAVTRDEDRTGEKASPVRETTSEPAQHGPRGQQGVAEAGKGGTTTAVPASNRKRRRQRRTAKAVRTYSYALHSLKEVADKITDNRATGLGQSVQMVQHMVDMVINDDNVLLDLSTIHDYDDYTFTHSVNVCILSLCLGHRIGLSKVPLARLGLCALFHDIGKLDVPHAILNKPGKLEDHELRIIQQHSLNSVRRILKLRASYDRKAGILVPPFEHHLRYDLSGYPKTPRKRPVSLFGSIITIADVYDAISAPRVYRSSFMSPDQALGFMLEKAGSLFHPILTKVFINMLGLYPIGTVLVFDREELGLVCHPPDETIHPEGLWAVLLVKEGKSWRKGEYLYLGEKDSGGQGLKRKVLRTMHPADLGIQPALFLL